MLIYRINNETPVKSSCHYLLMPLSKANLVEVDQNLNVNDFSDPNFPVTEMSPEEELILERNIVWVLGSPRSGTSWLALELLSLNNFTMNEPLIGMHLGDHFENVYDNRFNRVIDTVFHRTDYFFSYKYSKTWNNYLRKLILHRIHAQFHDLKRKVIIKAPNDSIAADIICDCLPYSKIIVLLRDGRDVLDSRLDSLRKGGWSDRPPGLHTPKQDSHDTKVNNMLPLPQAARTNIIKRHAILWNTIMDSVMRAYEKHAKEFRLMVRYEDLVVNTPDILKKIYRFIETSVTDSQISNVISRYNFENIPALEKGSGKFRRAATPGSWQQNFTKEEKILIHQMIGENLKKLGYD